jgi:LEA14-like dessication related protein
MHMKRTLILSLLACLLVISCGAPLRQLEYQDVKNFSLLSLSLTPQIGMDLQFYNPNTSSLTLKDVNINVFINEKQIGNAALANTFIIPGNDTFMVPVKLQANLGGLFSNAYSILSNKEVDVRLQGNVKAGKGIYLNIPINYHGKQRLNVAGMR